MPRASADLVSGVWDGHFEQLGRRFPQKMTLEFADGLVRGDGVDDLGSFTVEGEYRADEGGVRVGWIKTYEGAHSVLYLGTVEGRAVRGRWSIDATSGAFALQAVRELGT
ncbi:MAG: hypothetical protein R3A52_33030 [Polyangiales bacterium]